MKLVLKFLAATSLLTLLNSPVLAEEIRYPDVPTDHWAYQSLETLAEEYGLILGYPDGSFKGNRQVTRYELAALVLKLSQMTSGNSEQETLDSLKAEFAKEIEALKDQDAAHLDAVLDRLDLLEVEQMENKEKMETWLDKNLPVRVSGDIALRYEHKASDLMDFDTIRSTTPQTRVTLSLDSQDEGQPFLYGTRLSVGNTRNPANPWWRVGDFYARLDFALDRYFITWRPADFIDFTAGKFKNVYSNSELFMDFDVQPEGAMQRLHFKNISPFWSSLSFTLGETIINLNPLYQGNAFLLSGKADTSFSLGSAVDLKLSGAYHQYVQENVLYSANKIASENNQDPRVLGNAMRNTAGTQFGIANGFASLTWHLSPEFPVVLSGDYLYNMAASSLNQGLQGSLSLGSTRRVGGWELAYLYKYLEADASVSYFVEDQLGGTDIMAHEGQASVKVWDKTTLFGTYQYASRLSSNDVLHTVRLGVHQAF